MHAGTFFAESGATSIISPPEWVLLHRLSVARRRGLPASCGHRAETGEALGGSTFPSLCPVPVRVSRLGSQALILFRCAGD